MEADAKAETSDSNPPTDSLAACVRGFAVANIAASAAFCLLNSAPARFPRGAHRLSRHGIDPLKHYR
jgi:hypothetical protein